MVFVAPNWFTGALIWGAIYILPFLVILMIVLYGLVMEKFKITAIGVVLIVLCIIGSSFIWYETMEAPSVNEKVITVQEWQPRADIGTNENGMMVVDSADDLMLITTDGECFVNTENFWFQKFNTRDPFNQLKVNGTYKIRYYGWREPFNTGFPNILSVEEVIDESNTTAQRYSDYFGVKLVN